MLGYIKMGGLTAIKGVPAAAVTDAQLATINQELSDNGFNVGVVSESQLQDAQALQATNNTQASRITELEGQLATLTTERDTFKADAEKYAKLPGAEATGSKKDTETSTASEEVIVLSETDVMAQQQAKNAA